jgi:hypothetical protein
LNHQGLTTSSILMGPEPKQLNLQRHILSIINAAPQPFGIGIFTLLKPSDLLRSNLPICGFQFVVFVHHRHSCRLNHR